MLFNKKLELEAYKKQQALLVREERKMMKELLDSEKRQKQESRTAQMRRIQELENKLLVEIESQASKSRNSSFELGGSRNLGIRSESPGKEHLNKMKELQGKARDMLNGKNLLEQIPESPPKGESNKEKSIKIPIMIPQSVYRKAQHLPPPTMQRVLKSGEVITVHLLSDKSRVNDPLVRAEAQIDAQEISTMSKQLKTTSIPKVIQELQKQLNPQNPRSESLEPKKRYKNAISLPEAELPPPRQCTTPKNKAEYYNFRDIALDIISQQTHRSWVIQRMKQYSEKVKKNYLPKQSSKKELEFQLMLEKLKSPKPKSSTTRYKLL